MHQVTVNSFGGPEVLQLQERDTPTPGEGEVLVRFMSIGMNHADLMGRRGEYKLSTGDPPFTPGLEGGGVIESVGAGVDQALRGQRVTLRPETPRLEHGRGGTYCTHYLCSEDDVFFVPDAVSDDLLGALWLSHFTAWGALIWKLGRLGKSLHGARVAMPAASSAVALAAAQVVRQHGGAAIGLTTSPDKADDIAGEYDHVVMTHEVADGERKLRPFHRDLKAITDGKGVDVFFDPVAAGEYLNTEIRALANYGVILVYGLLGSPGDVSVTPLIRKHALIAGYVNDEVFAAGRDAVTDGCRHVVDGFAQGVYCQQIARTFSIAEVQEAHRVMERGGHVGKLVLRP